MNQTSLPRAVRVRLQQALTVLRAWNEAITQARRMEAGAQQPGRYEYDLRYTDAGGAQRTRLAAALATLHDLECMAATHGLPPEALYGELGGKPPLLAEGPQVATWR
jgi:hypothetical protein